MKNLFLVILILFTGSLNATENHDISTAKKLFVSGKINDALLLLKSHTDSGSANAAYALATLYEKADSFFSKENKLLKAIVWYKVAAERNHAKAQYRLGSLYYAGSWRGKVNQDLDQALKWFELSAKQGDFLAQFKMGNLNCWFGKTIKGYAWFTYVIEQGEYNANNARKERARICKNLTPEMIKNANNLAKQYSIDFSSTKNP